MGYTIWFDPLRHVPGPVTARFNPFWVALQCRLFRRSKAIHTLHEKYGPVVRVGPKSVSVASGGCLQKIYGPKSGAAKGPFYDVFHSTVPILFSAKETLFHSQRRKDLTPAFTKAAIRTFEPHMSNQIFQLKLALLRKVDENGGAAYLDFKPWANYLAFDVIADFVFGRPFGFIGTGSDFYNLIATIDNRMRCLNALGALPWWARSVATCIPFDPFWKMNQVASVNLRGLAKESLQKRRASKMSDRVDMLSFLMKAKQNDGALLAEPSILAEAASFISGGSDSTSTTLTHFVDLVSSHHSVKTRLQSELDRAFPAHDVALESWVPPEVITGSLPYLTACLRETMRLRPTSAAGLERIILHESFGLDVTDPATDRLKFIRLPVGTLISVPTYTLHRREDIFPHAEEFRPERWLDDALIGPNKELEVMMGSWAPFSFGTRGCLGKSFAWMELSKAAAMLFRQFEVIRASKEPADLTEGFFLKAKECTIVIVRRD